MSRPLRAEVAGGVHHVYARGAARLPIFGDDADRRRYLSLLSRVSRRMSWRCLSYCLMSNHMHLLVETPEPNLGLGMQRLHGGYAFAFNRRHGRSGHLFERRYDAVSVSTDEYLWSLVRYIAHNPVEAGMCARPEDWPWSSHAAIVEDSVPPWLDVPRLLSYVTASNGGDPRSRYAELVKGV